MRIEIEHCRLSDECTQRWDALEPVRDNPRLRYCDLCQSAVHLVEDEHELADLVRLGKSVAVLRPDLPAEAATATSAG